MHDATFVLGAPMIVFFIKVYFVQVIIHITFVKISCFSYLFLGEQSIKKYLVHFSLLFLLFTK